jgi:hypothetical protein
MKNGEVELLGRRYLVVRTEPSVEDSHQGAGADREFLVQKAWVRLWKGVDSSR